MSLHWTSCNELHFVESCQSEHIASMMAGLSGVKVICRVWLSQWLLTWWLFHIACRKKHCPRQKQQPTTVWPPDNSFQGQTVGPDLDTFDTSNTCRRQKNWTHSAHFYLFILKLELYNLHFLEDIIACQAFIRGFYINIARLCPCCNTNADFKRPNIRAAPRNSASYINELGSLLVALNPFALSTLIQLFPTLYS